MVKVICVDNKYAEAELSVGKEYTGKPVLGLILVLNDRGVASSYAPRRFKYVSEGKLT